MTFCGTIVKNYFFVAKSWAVEQHFAHSSPKTTKAIYLVQELLELLQFPSSGATT